MGAGVFGLGCTLAALAPGYWWFAAALALSGAAVLTLINGTNSIMQLSTEPSMRGRVMALRVGYDKLNAETGWEPKISWEDGVLRTIRWYSENRHRWIGRVDWQTRDRASAR